eukprot:CAMPEP_0180148150 /NCGR_PEP_ID=MMETSP0986-20121125/19783_1 /TAXON_ID=697907 /ORGANISM="non described non described, Strain CCMP2293" /LENGTH=70 /DNA_ID=CAMNT_0022094041 /DNA_START=156 /DNA_END=368 /DNA_ORIENTATION=-
MADISKTGQLPGMAFGARDLPEANACGGMPGGAKLDSCCTCSGAIGAFICTWPIKQPVDEQKSGRAAESS